MSEGLRLPTGEPVDVKEVEQDFARAMAADTGDEKDLPKKAAEPVSDAPKKRGRPQKHERARTSNPRTAKTAQPAQTDTQRKEGVTGLVQLGAGLALMAGKASGQDAFQADAVTLANNAEALADAAVSTAKADARFARALDRVTAVGPYGALLSAVLGTGLQIVRNHKPSAELPGTVDPKLLLSSLDQEAEHGPVS